MTSSEKKLLWIAIDGRTPGLHDVAECVGKAALVGRFGMEIMVGLLSGIGPASDPAALDRFLGDCADA